MTPRPQKPLKINPNRHFSAKMPKSYNGSISKRVSPIKLQFEAQPGPQGANLKIRN